MAHFARFGIRAEPVRGVNLVSAVGGEGRRRDAISAVAIAGRESAYSHGFHLEYVLTGCEVLENRAVRAVEGCGAVHIVEEAVSGYCIGGAAVREVAGETDEGVLELAGVVSVPDRPDAADCALTAVEAAGAAAYTEVVGTETAEQEVTV